MIEDVSILSRKAVKYASSNAALAMAECEHRGMMIPYMETCPAWDCDADLHWHNIAGMRIYVELRGRELYEARCPECNRDYLVDRAGRRGPKE